MSKKHSLDLADRNSFKQHPDLVYNQDNGSTESTQSRNRSERKRLQRLQRTLTNSSSNKAPRTHKEKFNVWLINEGPRQIFFGLWIFLHFLVFIFSLLNYRLCDNLEDARATYGITYRALFFFPIKLIFDPFSSYSYCSISSTCSLCRCRLYLVASLS
jgi:hypothetical protein